MNGKAKEGSVRMERVAKQIVQAHEAGRFHNCRPEAVTWALMATPVDVDTIRVVLNFPNHVATLREIEAVLRFYRVEIKATGPRGLSGPYKVNLQKLASALWDDGYTDQVVPQPLMRLLQNDQLSPEQLVGLLDRLGLDDSAPAAGEESI